jgi:hypothetical protein
MMTDGWAEHKPVGPQHAPADLRDHEHLGPGERCRAAGERRPHESAALRQEWSSLAGAFGFP